MSELPPRPWTFYPASQGVRASLCDRCGRTILSFVPCLPVDQAERLGKLFEVAYDNALAVERLENQLRDARDTIERLQAELKRATDCPQCRGTGSRWYMGRGMDSCVDCKGTGKR